MGARFSAPLQTGPGAHPASYTMGTASFPGVKRPGRGVDHPHPSSAEVKKEYRYISTSPLGLRGLLYVNFTFTFTTVTTAPTFINAFSILNLSDADLVPRSSLHCFPQLL